MTLRCIWSNVDRQVLHRLVESVNLSTQSLRVLCFTQVTKDNIIYNEKYCIQLENNKKHIGLVGSDI